MCMMATKQSKQRLIKIIVCLTIALYIAIISYISYISVLPQVQLAIPVEPHAKLRPRPPTSNDPQIFKQFLSSGYQASPASNWSDDATDEEYEEQARSRWSRGEIAAVVAFSTTVLFAMSYIFYTLYKCCCCKYAITVLSQS